MDEAVPAASRLPEKHDSDRRAGEPREQTARLLGSPPTTAPQKNVG